MTKGLNTLNESERRRLSRIRRDNVARRATIDNELIADHKIFLLKRKVVIAKSKSKDVEAILIPDTEWHDHPGRYPTRGMVRLIRNALAVHAYTTYYGLLQLGDSWVDAVHRIEAAAGKTWPHLRETALKHLGQLTVFRDGADVRAWHKQNFGARRNQTTEDLIASELAVLDLLSFAYNRAERVVTACEEGQWLRDRAAEQGIDVETDKAVQDEYVAIVSAPQNSPGWDRPLSDLLQVAMYADVNPTAIWWQHRRDYTMLFELARFMGRIYAGREATLQRDCHKLISHMFSGKRTYEREEGEVAARDVRDGLLQFFSAEQFMPLLADADAGGGFVVVTAVTRKLTVVAPAGPSPTQSARAVRFFDLLWKKYDDFFRANPGHRRSP